MVTGHKKEFQEAINLLKTRGFVVSVNGLNYEQSVLYQYNFDTLRFEKSSKQQLLDLWDKIYINSYGRDYSFTEIILSLTGLSNSKIKNYHKHCELLQKQSADLNKLNELTKELLKKNNARKKEIPLQFVSNQELLQHLINEDVFFDNGKFYKYNGSRFVFVNQIGSIFGNDLKNFSFTEINTKAGLFARYLTNANGIISDWIEYDLQQRLLSETKADYEAISNLIKSFE